MTRTQKHLEGVSPTLNQVVHFRPEEEQEGACHPDTWKSGRPVEARLLERPVRYGTVAKPQLKFNFNFVTEWRRDIWLRSESVTLDRFLAMSCLPTWFRCVCMPRIPIRHWKHHLPPTPTDPQAVNGTFEAVHWISRVYLHTCCAKKVGL